MNRGAEVSGELIFVVDDDDAVRASLQALLETEGYRTIQFESGIAFLDSLDSGPGACVLLDVKMPGLDGLEVQRRLNDRGVRLPVVIVTGHGDIAMAVQAMRAGAADFLEKPVSRDRLLASVARAIDIRRNARQDQLERSDIGTRPRRIDPARATSTRTARDGSDQQDCRARAGNQLPHRRGVPPQRHGKNGCGQSLPSGADDARRRIDPLGGKALSALGTR